MIRILLVRHGLAGKPDPKAYPDDDLRPLTGKGRKAFRKAAKGLRGLFPEPGRILVSPALRTRQTAEMLAEAMGLEAGLKSGSAKSGAIAMVPELHHRVSPAKALDRLARMRLPRSVILVGHEPWLGELLSLLITGGSKYVRTEFAKGGACLVECESMDRGKGVLHWLLTQEQLGALA